MKYIGIFYIWLASTSVGSAAVNVPNGMVSVLRYSEMNFSEQIIYIAGLIDGYYASPLLEGSEKKTFALLRCSKDYSNGDIAKIINSHIQNDPSSLRQHMNSFFYRVWVLPCIRENGLLD